MVVFIANDCVLGFWVLCWVEFGIIVIDGGGCRDRVRIVCY